MKIITGKRMCRILEQRGTMLAFLGKTATATPDFNQALVIRRARPGSEHPDVASSLFDLGRYRESVDMDRRLLPSGHPQLAIHQLALARQAGSEPLATGSAPFTPDEPSPERVANR